MNCPFLFFGCSFLLQKGKVTLDLKWKTIGGPGLDAEEGRRPSMDASATVNVMDSVCKQNISHSKRYVIARWGLKSYPAAVLTS